MSEPIAASHFTPSGAFVAGRTLRIGVILDAPTVPAWQVDVLRRVTGSPCVDLALAIVCNDAAAPRASQTSTPAAEILWRTIARLDAKMVCERDACEATDAAAALSGVPVLRGGASSLDPERLSAHDVDLLLDFSAQPVGELAARAKCAVWRPTQPGGAFWPVYRRGVGAATLEEWSPDGVRQIIAQTAPAPNVFSMKLTASAFGWRMASLVVGKLEARARFGRDERGEGALDAGNADRTSDNQGDAPVPHSGHLALYVARNVARRARAFIARRFEREQWILMLHIGRDLCTNPDAFSAIAPPADRFWADPHVVARHGRFYVFVEECSFATNKGRIAVVPIEPDGTAGEALPVLEHDYHLSYPFVFEHEGTLFMVPESEANRTVDLYRCVDFPQRWEHVETLLAGIAATDSTLIRHDGRWWLFANVVDTPGAAFSEELHIYHSTSLTGGEWTAHRQNPVISDARRARPAGAIFSRGGRLYRPGQDCSRRYGYGIRLHRIDVLTPDDYRETEVTAILPKSHERVVGFHTLAYTPGATLIDALRPRVHF